jgi:hypothetical protein
MAGATERIEEMPPDGGSRETPPRAASPETNARVRVLIWVTAAVVIPLLTWHAGFARLRPFGIYLLLIPTLLGVLFVHRNLDNPRLRPWVALLILAASMFCVDMAQVISQARPTVQNWLQRIVEDPQTTSYYTDAMRFVHQSGWIATFQDQTLQLHSSTHPAGPILFYVLLIDGLGSARATLAGPLLIAVLSAASVLAMYYFAGIWTSVRRDRMLICLLWTLCPAIGLVYPEFDQVYPVLSMLMLASWVYSLQRGLRFALLLGFSAFLATLFAYNLLVVGTFVACSGIGFLWLAQWRKSAVLRLIQAGCFALGLFLVLHVTFSLATGYHAWASFVHSLHVQKMIEKRPHGLYAAASNIYNFSLGSGFVPEILGVFFLVEVIKSPQRRNVVWIAMIASALTLIAVEATGILDYEAQRVWLFLQPLIFVPAALKLGEFSRKDQTGALLAQWALLATIGRSVLFVVPFP